MDRRQYLTALTTLTTATIAGCSGDDDDGNGGSGDGNGDGDGGNGDTAPTATETITATETATATETETATATETPLPDPEFSVEIDAPDTVETGEEWSVEIQVSNTGGPGEFQSTLSARFNEGEWQNTDMIVEEEIDANESKTIFTSDGTSYPTPRTLDLRVDRVNVTATTEVVWGDPYDPDTIRDIATTPDYDELFRNFESYQGEAVHFRYGAIYQTIYADEENPVGGDYLQMEVANNSQEYEGDIAADWYGDGRLLEEDIIELWGVAEELYSYETVQGDTRTIPRITMTDFELREE